MLFIINIIIYGVILTSIFFIGLLVYRDIRKDYTNKYSKDKPKNSKSLKVIK